jgi:hypothetical protein
MSKIEKVLATGKTHTTVSNAGTTSRGHDGSLDITLATPSQPTYLPPPSRTRRPSNCSPVHGRPATPPPSGWWPEK